MKSSFSTHIQSILSHLPQSPGVYQMKNHSGKVIYVGKSVNLKSRVSSYFSDHGGLTLAKKNMVSQIADIEIILTETEIEALVLETNLIKHLSPKYNILMKDDKNLTYIKITASPVPEVYKTRKKIRDGGVYFGPYTSAGNITGSLDTLKKLFHVRKCRMKFVGLVPPCEGGLGGVNFSGGSEIEKQVTITDKAGKTPPCMDYYIGICPAPCLLTTASLSTHQENVSRLTDFLSGRSREVIEGFRTQMKRYAEHLEFERAGEYKALIESLEAIGSRQIARDALPGDHDIIVMLEKYEKCFFGLTKIRGGQIVGVFRYESKSLMVGQDYSLTGGNEEEGQFDSLTGETREERFCHCEEQSNPEEAGGGVENSSADEIFSQFLAREYLIESSDDLPESVIVDREILDSSLLSLFQREKISITLPSIGVKRELLDFTRNQVREYAYKQELREIGSQTLTRSHMASILSTLRYPVPKSGEIIFECYDISHTDGRFTVASRVCIVNGKPDTNRYKKYKIRTLTDGQIDDFASHREVMTRRTIEGLREENFPHLIIIDGGKGQLSSAIGGIREGITNYELRITNREGVEMVLETTQPPLTTGGSTKHIPPMIPLCSIAKREEEIFLPNKKDPILFQKGSPELQILQLARDESHRFSITANRRARTKEMKKNILESLPGFGPVTRKKLLKLAGSVDQISTLSESDLLSVCTRRQVETLRDHGLFTDKL